MLRSHYHVSTVSATLYYMLARQIRSPCPLYFAQFLLYWGQAWTG